MVALPDAHSDGDIDVEKRTLGEFSCDCDARDALTTPLVLLEPELDAAVEGNALSELERADVALKVGDALPLLAPVAPLEGMPDALT